MVMIADLTTKTLSRYVKLVSFWAVRGFQILIFFVWGFWLNVKPSREEIIPCGIFIYSEWNASQNWCFSVLHFMCDDIFKTTVNTLSCKYQELFFFTLYLRIFPLYQFMQICQWHCLQCILRIYTNAKYIQELRNIGRQSIKGFNKTYLCESLFADKVS